MPSQLKTIANFLTPEDAEVARLALEDEGIASFLENATTIGMVWYWGNATGWVKLLVPEADEERARAILAKKGVNVDARSCLKCGASLPPDFDVCWSCQTPIDAEGGDAAVPPEEDRPEETAPGDEMAWRAFTGAVIGIFVCPPLLTFYSGWLLLRIALGGQLLSRKGSRSFYWAMVIDLAVCLIVGLCLARIR